jgi:hypothetical protein
MLVYIPFALCFVTFRGIFMHFLKLTYYQDATVPVPCFCYFCVSEKLHKKYSWNWMKQSQTFYFYQSFAKTEDETEGGQEPATP